MEQRPALHLVPPPIPVPERRPNSFLGVSLLWNLLYPSLQLLDSHVIDAGRELLMHSTFNDRFDTSLFDYATADDVEGFLREVLADASRVPVVVETQHPRGGEPPYRWPVGFEALRATGRPFARILGRWGRPLTIELEGPPDFWNGATHIVHGKFATGSDASVPAPEEEIGDDAALELAAREQAEWDSLRRQAALERTGLGGAGTWVGPGSDPSPTWRPPPVPDDEEDVLVTFVLDADRPNRYRSDEVTLEVFERECDGDQRYTCRVMRGIKMIAETDYSSLEELIDAELPRRGGFDIATGPEPSWLSHEADWHKDMLVAWIERNPDITLPVVVAFSDEAVAILRVDGVLRMVPGALEAKRSEWYWQYDKAEEVISAEWSCSFWWETGGVTSSSYSEDLVRFEDLYYLVKWKESGRESVFVGRYDSRVDARLAASQFSEAEWYREVVDYFGDEDTSGWSTTDEMLARPDSEVVVNFPYRGSEDVGDQYDSDEDDFDDNEDDHDDDDDEGDDDEDDDEGLEDDVIIDYRLVDNDGAGTARDDVGTTRPVAP